jgi:glutathione peroxidase
MKPMRGLSALLLSICVWACSATSTSGGGEQQSGPLQPKVPDTGPADPPSTGGPTVVGGNDPLFNPNAPACTGAPGSFYALTVRKLAGTEDIPFCRVQGRVVLIVNGASHCGYTPQYKPLEALYEKHKDEGLSIFAFPSDSFNQEDTNEQTVSDFCTQEYGITFPLFAIAPVKDTVTDKAQPVYQWIYAQPAMSAPVAWNFEKFLISAEGKIVKRWLTAVAPTEGGEIELAIIAELGKIKK